MPTPNPPSAPPPLFAPVATPTQLGAALRDARQRLGWTYAKAAEKCRVSYKYYWELEHGRRPRAQLDNVLAVVKAMGLALTAMPAGGAAGPTLARRAQRGGTRLA